jgi:hypothetical protein
MCAPDKESEFSQIYTGFGEKKAADHLIDGLLLPE